MDAAMLPLSAVPVIATAALLGGCLLVLGLFLNLPQGQRRPYRSELTPCKDNDAHVCAPPHPDLTVLRP